MNGRFPIILICVLCGAFLLSAGCTTPAPSGGAAPTPTAGGTGSQVAAANPDLGTVITLLRSISDQVSLVAENTRPQSNAAMTGNIVLFDSAGDTTHTLSNGAYVVALPQGTCDIAVFGDSQSMFITLEELKDYSSKINSRNYQACAGYYVCRRTVSLDSDYPYLMITAKPYDSTKRMTRVTLAYRCGS